ncbi:MAG: hypothetical protein KFF77_09580 [Bacteroidetes bacterium]|nr:hypothetical protein [Bacteroidota bacterium]
MDIMTLNELRPLAERHEEPCISLYMPTHRIWSEAPQDIIRFRNLIKRAAERIDSLYPDDNEARALLDPARELVDDDEFWRYQSDGLALFLSPDYFETFRVARSFAEEATVGHRFNVTPLLPVFTGDGRYYVLAVSQNRVRLLEGSRTAVEEIHPEGLPENLADALGEEYSARHLQFHTGTSGAAGARSAMYYGHDSASHTKDMVLRYFRRIDSGLRRVIAAEQVPLVLACVDSLLPIYREANSYAHLLDDAITGNPDELKPEELRTQAWNLVSPWYQRSRENAISRYLTLSETEKTGNAIEEVLPEAYFGRVDTLLVAMGTQVPGAFSPSTGEVDLDVSGMEDSEDLLNTAAIHTLLNGGKVYAIPPAEMPAGVSCAALYRY